MRRVRCPAPAEGDRRRKPPAPLLRPLPPTRPSASHHRHPDLQILRDRTAPDSGEEHAVLVFPTLPPDGTPPRCRAAPRAAGPDRLPGEALHEVRRGHPPHPREPPRPGGLLPAMPRPGLPPTPAEPRPTSRRPQRPHGPDMRLLPNAHGLGLSSPTVVLARLPTGRLPSTQARRDPRARAVTGPPGRRRCRGPGPHENSGEGRSPGSCRRSSRPAGSTRHARGRCSVRRAGR
ncbi:hypothetical protein GA0115234_10038 [Streptomyces sp. DvalAA-43]|nr:hypothetical protein GA0115234_10038 [Streptomyces sp. DvalAA-43]